jgi:hypothetical protein
VGFTNGIALVIASTQIPRPLRLQIDRVPASSCSGSRRWRPTRAPGRRLATALAGGSAAGDVAGDALGVAEDSGPTSWRSWAAPLPWAVLGLHVETIGTRFGGIRVGLARHPCAQIQG